MRNSPEAMSVAAGRVGTSASARTAIDLALIVVLVAVVVAIGALAPSGDFAFGQAGQMGAALRLALGVPGHNWLAPSSQFGEYLRTGPMYAWLDAVVLKITGSHSDLAYRAPTILASLVIALVTYLLGRRWAGREAGLLASALWATALGMGMLMFLARPAMLLAMWIALSILCLDRLAFHPARALGQRIGWAIGLWLSMILGGLTDGWGLANLLVVGATLIVTAVLATAPAGPAQSERASESWAGRLWRAVKATQFYWGLPLMALAIVGYLMAAKGVGGQTYLRGVWADLSRIPIDPVNGAVVGPGALAIVLYALPMLALAVLALLVVGPSRWYSQDSPTWLPLGWIIAAIIGFAILDGMRETALLAAYPAVAILAAVGIEALARPSPASAGARAGRLIIGLLAMLIGVGLMILCATYIVYELMPDWYKGALPGPSYLSLASQVGLVLGVGLGVATVMLAVTSGLGRDIRRAALGLVLGMVGALLLYSHGMSLPARSGDGQRMEKLVQLARPMIKNSRFAVFQVDDLGFELYLGRFGERIPPMEKGHPAGPLQALRHAGVPWLVTSDRGLAELGAAKPDRNAVYALRDAKGRDVRLRTNPKELGTPKLYMDGMLSGRRGTLFLIQLQNGRKPSGQPFYTGQQPDEQP